MIPVAPEIAEQLAADWSEPVQFKLEERNGGYELILRLVALPVLEQKWGSVR